MDHETKSSVLVTIVTIAPLAEYVDNNVEGKIFTCAFGLDSNL